MQAFKNLITSLSKTFMITDVKVTGLYTLRDDTLPYFWIGMIVDVLKHLGTWHFSRDMFFSCRKYENSVSALMIVRSSPLDLLKNVPKLGVGVSLLTVSAFCLCATPSKHAVYSRTILHQSMSDEDHTKRLFRITFHR